MDNLFGIVEAFYSRFILRDLMGKIAPGAILMFALSENLRSLVLDNSTISNARNRYIDYLSSLDEGSQKTEKDVERIVVIKETCGNTYVSMLISIFFVSFDHLIRNRFDMDKILSNMAFIIIYFALMISLRYMHFEHLKRLDSTIKKFMANEDDKKRKQGDIKDITHY